MDVAFAFSSQNRSEKASAGIGGTVSVRKAILSSGIASYDDRGWDRGDERHANRTEGLMSAPTGTKLGDVEWLRCCQIGCVLCLLGGGTLGLADILDLSYEEALPVLYGTNVFVPREGIDTPFIMSRLLSPTCSQLIQSLDISIELWHGLDEASEAKSWATVYHAIFDLLEQCFCNVHRLRLTVKYRRGNE
jgi:hypothetical protein